MRIATLLLLAALCNATIVRADAVDPLIGTWVSPDGYAKQSFERAFDGSWIAVKLWFKADEDWKLVALGSLYQRPGDERWRGASRATDMEGIELFESILERRGDGTYRMANITYSSDGSVLSTEEDWVLDGPDRFTYTIYKIEDGDRAEWMSGSWLRQPD